MVYFISDTHFYHTAIIPYCQRPFLSVDDMNEKLIENWNKVVTNEDTVYFLGDFGFSSAPKLKDITSRLNGYKIIIRGNHDRDRGEISWKNIGFDEVYKKKEVSIKEILGRCPLDCGYDDVIFSHSPRQVGDNVLNIHGHIHNAPLDTTLYHPENHFCASVEMIDYKPIPLSKILKTKAKNREE